MGISHKDDNFGYSQKILKQKETNYNISGILYETHKEK